MRKTIINEREDSIEYTNSLQNMINGSISNVYFGPKINISGFRHSVTKVMKTNLQIFDS